MTGQNKSFFGIGQISIPQLKMPAPEIQRRRLKTTISPPPPPPHIYAVIMMRSAEHLLGTSALLILENRDLRTERGISAASPQVCRATWK